MTKHLRSAALLATLASLAGCGLGSEEKFPPVCPSLALLDDAADLTRYRGESRDITDLMLDARITAVPAQCTRSVKNVVKTTLQVKASLSRGAAATSRQASVGYVLTVMDGERIVDQQDYQFATTFPSNVDRVDISSNEVDFQFPVSAQKSAAAYKIYVGFRLTPQELAINRQRGLR